MSETIIIATCVNLEGRIVRLLQSGRSYLVASENAPKECPHDKGWTIKKVEPDLYGYVCNLCHTVSASNPDNPSAVRYVRHTPGPDDKVLPPIDYKAGEL